MILPDIDSFYLQVSELIKTERIKKNYKQQQLCDLLGLSRGSITNLEKGKHRPSIYQLLKLAVFFGIDYTQLIPIELERQKKAPRQNSKLPTNPILGEDVDISKSGKGVENFLSDIKGGKQ
jgi:transcriptional regulator with XRE-family HTH domain